MQEQGKSKKGINGFTLKMVAMITMAIDHTGMVLFPQYVILRIIGRLAFPIYCFLLVEGAIHTSDRKRYLGRMFLFALISEIPFDLVCTGQLVSWDSQNVFFTLTMGLLGVLILQKRKNDMYGMAAVVFIIFLADWAQVDYGCGGIVFILMFYLFKDRMLLKSIAFGTANIFLYGGLASVQVYGCFSLIPIWLYNGKRGPKVKYLFYAFYPVHLLILYWMRLYWMRL